MAFNVAIVPFTIDLYDDVLALWRRCEGVGLSAADSRESITRYLERNPGMSFVARTDGRTVGALLAGHDGRRGFLHHLAVDLEFRRRGVGRALESRCIEALRREGIQKCHLFIYRTNELGAGFWNATGWSARRDIRVMSKEILGGR